MTGLLLSLAFVYMVVRLVALLAEVDADNKAREAEREQRGTAS